MCENPSLVEIQLNPVFSSSSPCAPDPELVGNKAANLWRLSRLGMCVPRWFVIDQNTFADILRRCHINIKKLIERHASNHVGEVFLEKLLSCGRETLDTLVRKQLDADFEHISLFSVRSSAIDEDSKRASFAGMMDSYLFVNRGDLVDKIAECAASALSERAILYRHARGIPFFTFRIAVIVQEMIDSRKAGIIFTRNPVSNTSDYLISAGFGVGEGVVSNRVETDTFWIDSKSGEVIRSQIHTKKTKMSMAEGLHKNTAVIAIKAFNQPVLTSDEIRILFKMIKTIESDFDGPQDIEWAFDPSGMLYLLQTRPITSQAIDSENITVWDNSNIVESYPGVTTPLTFSFARNVYENVMKRTVIRLTLNRKGVEKSSPIFEALIGYLDGRIYYNLTNWYSMVSFNPALAKDKTACNRMLGIDDNSAVITPKVNTSYISYATLFWKFIFKGYYRRYFYRRFERIYAHKAATDFDAYSPKALYAIFKNMEADLFHIWPITIENDIFLIFAYELMNRFFNKTALSGRVKNHLLHLLSFTGNVESLKPVQSVLSICKMIQDSPDLTVLFNLDDKKFLRYLRETSEYKEVYDAFLTHIQKYGDRTFHELKLETKTMSDDPTILIRVIRRAFSCGNHLSFKSEGSLNDHVHETDIESAAGDNPLKRFFFRILVKIIREGIAHRENMRFARTRAYGLVKRIFCSIGRSFHQINFLEQRDDIFFLTMDEIFSIINGSSVSFDFKHTVCIRKQRYLRQGQSPTPPSRLITRGMNTMDFQDSYNLQTTTIENKVTNLRGIACSPGRASGQARIVRTPDPDLRIDGKILIAEMTDPGWVFLMMRAKGLVVERGSVLSHTAIIGRELGIPTIVAVKDATNRIPDGSEIFIDGSTGEIRWQ
jgi:phosphohistidine swiveling domain-containing protein